MKYPVPVLLAFASACASGPTKGPALQAMPTTHLAVPFGNGHLTIGDIDEEGAALGIAFFRHATGPVALTFRSLGGSVYHGLDLLREMELYPHPIVCRVDVAMSMGAVLTSACSTRYGLPRTMMMMHAAGGGAIGKSGDLDNASDHLRVISLALSRQFCGRLKIPLADCQAKFAGEKEWFFDAEEALAVGAIDYIVK